MRFRFWLLLLLLVLPGAAGFAVCMYFACVDWAALQRAYAGFAAAAGSSSGMPSLFVAEAQQNIHRINLFAEVVWALLCAVVAAIGLHGICMLADARKPSR